MAPRLRHPPCIAATLSLLLLLAACATPAEREAAALRAALESSNASLTALGACGGCGAAGGPEPPPPGAALLPANLPRAVPGGGSAAAAVPATAAELLGAGPEALRHLFGEPSLHRAEGTAEIWLYAGPACALDLILYPGSGGGLRVAHAAARANGAESRTEAACLRELGSGGGRGARGSARGGDA